MSIVHRLASAQGRRDEGPNIELAIDIANSGDQEAMDELAGLVPTATRKLRHDALKTMYEVGDRRPELLLPHFDLLVEQLASKDNRTLWSGLIGLSVLANVAQKQLMPQLQTILAAAERSTVIARDKAMMIMAGLAGRDEFYDEVLPQMLRHVSGAKDNQFPTYVEAASRVIAKNDHAKLARVITLRGEMVAHPAKQKRLEKVLKRLGNTDGF